MECFSSVYVPSPKAYKHLLVFAEFCGIPCEVGMVKIIGREQFLLEKVILVYVCYCVFSAAYQLTFKYSAIALIIAAHSLGTIYVA